MSRQSPRLIIIQHQISPPLWLRLTCCWFGSKLPLLFPLPAISLNSVTGARLPALQVSDALLVVLPCWPKRPASCPLRHLVVLIIEVGNFCEFKNGSSSQSGEILCTEFLNSLPVSRFATTKSFIPHPCFVTIAKYGSADL